MMLFALAGNSGGFGARGFTALMAGLGVAWGPPARDWLIRLESAAPPIPKPACLKKWRRVTARSISCIGASRISSIGEPVNPSASLFLLLRDRLVQIQQHIRNHGPGGQLRRLRGWT